MSFHLLSVQFRNYVVLCHTQIFDSDWVVFAKNFIHEVVRFMVVTAVDYPILCGPCMNINFPLLLTIKIILITSHLLFILDCRRSHSHCEMYCYEQLVSAKCASWYKWYWKFHMIYTKSTVLCERTERIVKKYWISRLVLDKQK